MRTRGTEPTMQEAAPVERRPFPRRLRSLSIVFLAVLISASVTAGWTVRGLVHEHERVLLKERTAEVNLVLGNLISSVQARLTLIGAVVRVSGGSAASFAGVAGATVALTASAVKGDEERCLEAGMDAYVTKPVTVAALGEVLGRLIEPDAGAEVLDPATVDGLWELGGDTPAVMEELADTFIEGAPTQIEALTVAVARADLETVARAAHQLRGSCAAVGARSMGGLAAEIEAAAVENHPERLPATVARIEQSFESARAALRAAARSQRVDH